MSAATLASPAIAEFAAAVRSALSDLAPDEVDDLTDGLEADLTDRVADGDAAELGDPIVYAEELRAAAGMPHRAPTSRGISEMFRAPQALARDLRRFITASPMLTRGAGFLVSLRPVWWVFRAVVATALVAIFSGGAPVNGLSVVFGIAALIVSVQFGRGKWLPLAWMRALLLATNIVLVIATPFVITGWATQLNNATYAQQYLDDSSGLPDQSGLAYNGNQVSNIFAYDAQGNPLTDVQLYDQDGKPLNLIGDPTSASIDLGSGLLVPNQHVPGRLGWNVFPLGHVASGDVNGDGSLKHSVTPRPARPPFAAATPLAGSGAAGATALPTPAPTSAPTPAPTP